MYLLVKNCFERLGLELVYMNIDERNHSSIRVAEKIGALCASNTSRSNLYASKQNSQRWEISRVNFTD